MCCQQQLDHEPSRETPREHYLALTLIAVGQFTELARRELETGHSEIASAFLAVLARIADRRVKEPTPEPTGFIGIQWPDFVREVAEECLRRRSVEEGAVGR